MRRQSLTAHPRSSVEVRRSIRLEAGFRFLDIGAWEKHFRRWWCPSRSGTICIRLYTWPMACGRTALELWKMRAPYGSEPGW